MISFTCLSFFEPIPVYIYTDRVPVKRPLLRLGKLRKIPAHKRRKALQKPNTGPFDQLSIIGQ